MACWHNGLSWVLWDQAVVSSTPSWAWLFKNWATCSYLWTLSVTKQYNLLQVSGWWCFVNGKVTTVLALHWPFAIEFSSYPSQGIGDGQWTHHITAASLVALAQGGGANWLQACCPCIQVLTWSSTVVSCWWTLPVGGSQPTTSPSFSAIFITGRPPCASVNHRRQSFSCLRRTCVERPAAARNVCILSAYFSQTSEDSPLPSLLLLTVCVVPEQWLCQFQTR